MTDERFERDLTSVLRGIAGNEAPASLRYRLDRITDRPLPGRRSAWFGTPWRLATAAVAVVALVATGYLFMPRVAAPLPSPSATASEPISSPSATVEPSATPGETPTTEPTATPQVTPTPGVSPAPVSGWTGLRWSDGVALPITDTSRLVMTDILRWGSGYVGAGFQVVHDPVAGSDTGIAPAFLTSRDGQHWTISQIGPPRQTEDALDVRLAVAGDTLIAIERDSLRIGGAPLLWRSDDGRAWTPVDSPTWRAAWDAGTSRALLRAVASGPKGIVAIGNPHADWGDPISDPDIAYSADGVTWDRITVTSAFADAYLYDVATFDGGFVIVGRTGQPDRPAGTGAGRPAAWVSSDGRTWRKASVPGESGPLEKLGDGSLGLGPRLSQVVAGADGLLALGLRAGAVGTYCCDPTSAWSSVDGRTWSFVGDLGVQLPLVDALAGDGSHIVLLGHQSSGDLAIKGWSSTSGVTWTRLAFSGSTAIPGRTTLAGESGPFSLDRTQVYIVPNGVLVGGSQKDVDGELFWFATASGP